MTRTHIATTTGLFPLPDETKHELRSAKGKQKEDLISGDEGQAIQDLYDQATQEVIEWQRTAGLDRVSDGQLRWDDMLCHPLAVHDAVEHGGLRRYYANNNFYREMRVTDALSPDGDLGREAERAAQFRETETAQLVIPGPTSLAELATDAYYDDPKTFIRALGEFLAGELQQVPGAPTLFVLDPSLAGGTPDHLEAAVEGLGGISDAARSAGIDDVIVHTYWGSPSLATYRRLREIDIGVGYDLITDHSGVHDLLESVGAPQTVALGVVDGQNTEVESVEEIHQRVERFEQRSDPERVYLTPNTEGFYLPTGRFREKLGQLGTAASAEVVA